MMRSIMLLWLVRLSAASAMMSNCDDGTCISHDLHEATVESSTLLQMKSLSQRVVSVLQGSSTYGPVRLPGFSALAFFKSWAEGGVSFLLSRELGTLGADTPPTLVDSQHSASGSDMINLLSQAASQACPGVPSRRFHETHTVHERSVDAGGVVHVLLRTDEGKLQYLAAKSQRLLAADPPVCPGHGIVFRQSDPSNIQQTVDGGSRLLDPNNDPMVAACKSLFHQTVQRSCDSQYDLRVYTATEHVIDGLAVNMRVSVSNGTYQDIECDFEVKGGTPDASLVEAAGNPSSQPFGNLEGTLKVVSGNICHLALASSVGADDANVLKLMATHQFGEISLYKGNEWMRASIATASFTDAVKAATIPSSYDITTSYAACFINNGQEAVRNQGDCGSCWAFAAASAAMANLCVSKADANTLATSSDRYEISVQQVMSCNAEGRGCNGGWANTAAGVWTERGFHKERDRVYQCGGGDPLNHFADGGDCEAAPWGAQCWDGARVSSWNFDGAVGVSGEQDMRYVLSQGGAMYVSFETHANFMQYPGGIYSTTSGGVVGGHAMNAVGYGTAGGTPYWKIQNSWGATWGESGYVRFLRGSDLAGIESGAVLFRSWVTGGRSPPEAPCRDMSSTGLTSNGQPVSCTQASQQGLCSDPQWTDYISVKCPVSCGVCSAPAPSPPSLAPTHAPSQAPTPASCTDTTTSCSSWAGMGFCDPSSQYYTYMSTNCCQSCSGPTPAPPSLAPTPAPTRAPTPAPTAACSDTSSGCPTWAGMGFCDPSSQYYTYMSTNCCQSCSGPTPAPPSLSPTPVPTRAPTPAPTSACTDTSTSCPTWAGMGFCSSSSQYYAYMSANCCQSCAR